ncbi:MAG: ABC transporter substrate-binding protein [Flavobacteriaceae bacterium]
MMAQLGALVRQREKALDLINGIRLNIDRIQQETNTWCKRPKVYFEEWYDPLITGIRWVSELIELAGGMDIYPEHKKASLAKDRIIKDMADVVQRNPDIILVSWCGKMFKKQKMLQRPNWNTIKALKTDAVHEIKSEIILQPGPAALMEGLPMLHQLFSDWGIEHG